jgi:hypothetical protein
VNRDQIVVTARRGGLAATGVAASAANRGTAVPPGPAFVGDLGRGGVLVVAGPIRRPPVAAVGASEVGQVVRVKVMAATGSGQP